LPADDLFGHARLAELVETPICLDESITSVREAVEAVALGACGVINLKPARVGGLSEALRIHDLCLVRGIGLWCGGMLETGIGRALNVALAALPGFTLPGDLSASDRYFVRDLTEPFVLDEGFLQVPRGSGIGVAPLQSALAEFVTSRETVAL
jgi:O-succinylbenzoate synthase